MSLEEAVGPRKPTLLRESPLHTPAPPTKPFLPPPPSVQVGFARERGRGTAPPSPQCTVVLPLKSTPEIMGRV